MQDFGIAMLATGMFNITSCCIVGSKVNIEGIKILNDTFSGTLVNIISDIIRRILSLGVGCILFGMILIGIYSIIYVSKKKKEETTDK